MREIEIEIEERIYERGVEIIFYNKKYISLIVLDGCFSNDVYEIISSNFKNHDNREIKKINGKYPHIPMSTVINWLGENGWKNLNEKSWSIDMIHESYKNDENDHIKLNIWKKNNYENIEYLHSILCTLSILHNIEYWDLINDIWKYWKK